MRGWSIGRTGSLGARWHGAEEVLRRRRREACVAAVVLALLASPMAGCASGKSSWSSDQGAPSEPDRVPDGTTPDAPDADVIDAAEPEPAPTWSFDDVTFPPRRCEVILRHWAKDAREVAVAGSFSAWQPSVPMSDPDGDGWFEAVIGPDMVAPGLHAYKFVVDGRHWVLDGENTHQRYVDGCLNSAFEMPRCDDGPAIVAAPLELETREAGGAVEGRLTATFDIQQATARVNTLSVRLDGEPLHDDAVQWDKRGRFTVQVDGLEEGKHRLDIDAEDSAGGKASRVTLPFWVEREPFTWSDSTMYMVVIDRFANGRRGNDAPVGGGLEFAADFHGGDLQGVTEVIRSGYFDRLGVNTIWLSPVQTQAEGSFIGRDGVHQYSGYHGYWPVSARQVEPRFGGEEALHELVGAAHARGIRVVLDLILNQVHEAHEYVQSQPDWFRTDCVCGIDPGCGFSERPLTCLFAPYLPDIDWQNDAAQAQFIEDAVYWVDEFNVDGFRVDAVKHVETSAIYNLRHALRSRFEQGGDRVFMVGETAVTADDMYREQCGGLTFDSGYAWVDGYVGERALDGQFDFPSHHRMRDQLLTDSLDYESLDRIVTDAQTRYRPGGLHVRFLGTHDSNRVISVAAADPAMHCKWPTRSTPGAPSSSPDSCASLAQTSHDAEAYRNLERAFTALFTMPGIPFLYYGDEVALPGGHDPDNRRDMRFDGKLAALAMDDQSLNMHQVELRTFMERLGRARARSMALRRGERRTLLSTANLYVYAYRTEGSLAVVALNRGAAINRNMTGLRAEDVRDISTLNRVVGDGDASLNGNLLNLKMGAKEAAIFISETP